MSSTEFYDKFISYQIKSGINDRIYGLYKRICKIGIDTNSRILEIGCGIGALTFLLSRKVRTGNIEAIDISTKSIEFAAARIKNPNILFSVADILNFTPAYPPFDKILLFDVLEHIPEQNHNTLFANISTWMKGDSLLLINIPNPDYILYDQKNNPGVLQETDQPIQIDKLIGVLNFFSLELDYFETYSVWVKNDYHFLVVKKRTDFVEEFLRSESTLFERIRVRLRREVRKILFRFPR